MVDNLVVKFKLWRERGKILELHDVVSVYMVILLVWGFYRLLFRLPEWVEELFLKPVVWLLPVARRVVKEEHESIKARLASVGVTTKNLGAAVALGLALGVFYLFVGRIGMMARSGQVSAPNLGGMANSPILIIVLALATAIAEQLVFMGYILPRLVEVWQHEWRAAITTAVLFGIVHLPILIFGYQLPLQAVAGQFVLVLLLGLGNSMVMLRVKNVVTPILSHALWGLAVLLG